MKGSVRFSWPSKRRSRLFMASAGIVGLLGYEQLQQQQQQHASSTWMGKTKTTPLDGTRIVGAVQALSTNSISSSTSHGRPTSTTTSKSTSLNLVDPQQQPPSSSAFSSSFLLFSPNNETTNLDGTENDAYFLLWSPSMWKKFVFTTAALILIPKLLTKTGIFTSTTTTAACCHSNARSLFLSRLWNNLALPLAASACCLLQLGLNLLAVGCAGWNKVLGPTRPYFLALLLVSSLQPPLPRPMTLVGRTVVALLPELLHLYNTHPAPATTILGANTNMAKEDHPNNMLVLEQVTLEIPTMGCVACIHSIQGALSQVPGVRSAKAQLYPNDQKGGFATVVLDPTSFGQSFHERQQQPEDENTMKADSDGNTIDSNNNNPATEKQAYQQLADAVYQAGFEGASVQSIQKLY